MDKQDYQREVRRLARAAAHGVSGPVAADAVWARVAMKPSLRRYGRAAFNEAIEHARDVHGINILCESPANESPANNATET
jgi:hypothetical protein